MKGLNLDWVTSDGRLDVMGNVMHFVAAAIPEKMDGVLSAFGSFKDGLRTAIRGLQNRS